MLADVAEDGDRPLYRAAMAVQRRLMLHLVPYDRTYLDLSYTWLSDPETKALTMTPDFTREDQQAFFAGLANRTDYRLWGVETDDEGPVGAAGIKRIADSSGEYWGYLGDKQLWGRGLGRHLVAAVEDKARRLGLSRLYLNVAKDNPRATSLYRRMGYAEAGSADDVLCMEKTL